MASLGCAIVDLDSLAPMDEARRDAGPDQVLLGNIDPVAVLMNGTPETVWEGLEECFQAASPRYVVGAGCEVPRTTPEENFIAMRDFARSRAGEAVHPA
jgi:uroporphyrinogen-III decarboxylase